MGHVVKRKIYELKFQDPDYEGLEVTTHSLNTGQFLDLSKATTKRAQGGEAGQEAFVEMLQLLADSLVSWNAEDEGTGEPIPMTLAGLLSQEPDFGTRIVEAWTDAIVGVSAPLQQTSSDGQPSLEASIPMDVPSESLAS